MPIRTDAPVFATAIAKSDNAKVGECAATYAAQQSCPSYCPFFDGGGCYAEAGRLFMGVTQRLNENAERERADWHDVAIAEARAIYEMDVIRGRPMRLHTVGDCQNDEAAKIVAAAAEWYMDVGGGPVWGYTHAWRVVARSSWGRVSILASCESAEQVELARARGYAPSIVVETFAAARKYEGAGGLEILPCPAQTRDDVTCASCRLCMNDLGIKERGYAIGFELHGTAYSIRQARKALRDPGDPGRRLGLREQVPAYLAEHPDASDMEIARHLGCRDSSVWDMRTRLAKEAA